MAISKSFEDKDFQKRIVGYAFKENPNIKNFQQFESAVFTSFDTKNGQNASKFFNNDEINAFFNNPETKRRIRDNVDEKEFKEMYKQEEHIVIREKPKGEIIKPQQIRSFSVPKDVRIKRGDKFYYKSKPQKWTNAQTNFIKARKMKKLSVKKIFHEYNQHFAQDKRTKDSITSKYYSI